VIHEMAGNAVDGNILQMQQPAQVPGGYYAVLPGPLPMQQLQQQQQQQQQVDVETDTDNNSENGFRNPIAIGHRAKPRRKATQKPVVRVVRREIERGRSPMYLIVLGARSHASYELLSYVNECDHFCIAEVWRTACLWLV